MNKRSVNTGKQLKFAREYRGLTQNQLCKKVKGLSQSNLSRFENGFMDSVNDDKLTEIMSVLEWPLKWLSVKALSKDSSLNY